jgi:ABC-type multidrug transport system ATPase subunit
MDLHIHRVSRTYANGVRGLADVTLTIPPGVFGIVGPEGAGKSTLMRILATRQEPNAGSIHLGHLDLVKHAHKIRKRLAYLPQDFMSQAKASADRLFATSPALVLVDEPGVGLQPSQRARFARLAATVADRCLIIVSTRRIQDVAELCTRMAVLDRGRLLLDTDTQNAVRELSGRVWHRVISNEALPRVEREYSVISATPVAGGAAVRVYSFTPPAVGFEQDDPTLEDVYSLTLRRARQAARLATVTEPALT